MTSLLKILTFGEISNIRNLESIFAFIIAPTKKSSGGNTKEDLKDYL